ncbi:Rha family transcriptional regulator [Leptotrichia sp. oral taxon 223]|uniref:Rha family transcriptional regulator n=1 Tax=Leptotrichia sp. oral taxon 223 TaxID=712363 RepID=UPI0015BB49F1|nr:Rha family transcriptional regulator [Leptotrichia sp. oral taxon 223]NWO18861.1 ORF6C domain-containing protein [Leptotrichia sp. oral taxon 223]
MNELINVKSRDTLTSLEVAQIAEKEHKNILADIRDEISKLGEERGRLIFQPTTYIDNFNRSQPMFLLNYKGVLQLGARYSAETRFKLIEKIEELKKPMAIEDMIILQANEMKSVKHRIDIVENKVDNEIRIDHTEQRKLQKAVSIRVYQRLDVIDADRNLMFPAIYRDLKDRFGVASYRDIKRKDLTEALAYVQNWIEKAELRN